MSRDSVWKILVPYVFFISDQWPINTIATFHFCLQIRKIWTGQNCPTIFIAFFGVGELNWLGLVSCCQWQLTRRLIPIGIKVSLSLSPLMIFFSLHLLIGRFSHFVLDYHHALLPLQCSQVSTQQYTFWIQKIYSHYKPKKNHKLFRIMNDWEKKGWVVWKGQTINNNLSSKIVVIFFFFFFL